MQDSSPTQASNLPCNPCSSTSVSQTVIGSGTVEASHEGVTPDEANEGSSTGDEHQGQHQASEPEIGSNIEHVPEQDSVNSGEHEGQHQFYEPEMDSNTEHVAEVDSVNPDVADDPLDNGERSLASGSSTKAAQGKRVKSVENVHPMITRRKDGIHKPKIFNLQYKKTPETIDEALADDDWRAATMVEYEALVTCW
ncbi:hypothetical protein V6N13_091275 [Hibiscus sabdariffa]|uniref:Uncharacterized protein n=1 Tax=Hibiscus sabdariffa TaxID=183260 RepID=A0ABR2BUV5_9ROSI